MSVSFNMIDNEKLLRDIYASRQSGKILTGELSSVQNFVTNSNKKIQCAVVFYGDIKVFIPISEMNVSREDIKVLKSMAGATIDFVIKELDVEKRQAAASRKIAMELRRKIELPKYKVGDIINVRVTGIGLNNAIVEAFGIETSIAKDDIDWGYINSVNDVLQIGDIKPALIKDLNIENEEIKVSLKEATEDPYLKNVSSLQKNELCLGIVTGVTDFGIFHEIKHKKGVTALCPHPNWKNFSPKNGDENLIKISRIDINNRKIDANLQRPVRKARL